MIWTVVVLEEKLFEIHEKIHSLRDLPFQLFLTILKSRHLMAILYKVFIYCTQMPNLILETALLVVTVGLQMFEKCLMKTQMSAVIGAFPACCSSQRQIILYSKRWVSCIYVNLTHFIEFRLYNVVLLPTKFVFL